MPEPYRRLLRESDLFLAAGCCRSQDPASRNRHLRDFSWNAFVRLLRTSLLSLSLFFRHVLILFVFRSFDSRMDFPVFVVASGIFRRAIPPRDDSPEPSSILLYIPYVTFTMGSKEARNGRPVIELNSSEFRSAPGARSILFYSPRLGSYPETSIGCLNGISIPPYMSLPQPRFANATPLRNPLRFWKNLKRSSANLKHPLSASGALTLVPDDHFGAIHLRGALPARTVDDRRERERIRVDFLSRLQNPANPDDRFGLNAAKATSTIVSERAL